MEPALLQTIIIIVCIIMSAFFSATETAFSTFNRIRMKNIAEKGNRRASLALKLSDNYDKLITTILIGNNIVNILSTALGTLLFVGLLKNESLGTTVSTVVLTLAVLIFGEISPKTIAKKAPESFTLFAVSILNFFFIIFTPLTFIFKCWQNLLSKLFKQNDDQGITEEELISIIEEAEEEGDLDENETTLIKSAIEFNDLDVGEIFTPRIDITAIPTTATKDDISTVFSESGYSRLPVYEGDLDNIIGIVYYKDFYNSSFKDNSPISEIVKPVIYVAKTQKINDLLKELQNKQLHLAVVLDEYGSTAGIVTLEDILEEIVGEIWDEHDEVVEEIKQVEEKEYIVSGMASISKLFDLLEIDLETESTTVNGWAMEELGKVPEVKDKFTSDLGLEVEILTMDGKRVEELRIIDIRKSEEELKEEEKRAKRSDDDSDDEKEESHSVND